MNDRYTVISETSLVGFPERYVTVFRIQDSWKKTTIDAQLKADELNQQEKGRTF